ncbi:MAG: hypothetical protein HYS24_13895 [Ignavibacteriales bacterium]|nr:hypothetical protein [Ignavibacteriales bacterium]
MTASEKYTKDHNQLKKMLKEFEKQLELHSKKFKQTGSTDWGFVGDLDRYQNQIGDVLIPLKDSL